MSRFKNFLSSLLGIPCLIIVIIEELTGLRLFKRDLEDAPQK